MAQTASIPSTAAAGARGGPAISVNRLKMGYGKRVLLDNASFDVHRGEILVILGGSGCGKSSLMKNIIGLYQPMAGDILIEGDFTPAAVATHLPKTYDCIFNSLVRGHPCCFCGEPRAMT